MANALENETSPYLKQHAHNPVAWMPWSDNAWKKARAENKPVLVSIGYAACHWCHVMERESFENEAIAAIMNRDFICIKVDREERPDVDQVYIEAVQLLSGHAGWPLNCFCMPDGRPVYGGTYFQPGQWTQLLRRLTALWKEDRDSLEAQAGQLTAALQSAEIPVSPPPWERERVLDQLRQGVERGKLSFDRLEGGSQRAPKFPLPVNWRFLLRYGEAVGDKAVMRQVYLTLGKMADGGIHDQIGGGFARYSVDGIWKVPHFEKMLYDNGQLLGLYAQAYAAAKAMPPESDKVLLPAYHSAYWREVASSLVAFLRRDLGAEKGLFHASLDADSEGEEGRFYVWTREELQSLLGDDFSWFSARHGVDERGYWEEEKHILLRCGDDGEIAADHGFTVSELRDRDEKARAHLLALRSKRIAPGLDDKVWVSWNALAITGLAEAGMWLGETAWVEAAVKAGETLMREAMQEDGGLRRSRQHGHFAIAGFLEDYAHLAWAFLRLHRATQNTLWVFAAEKLVTYAEAHFSDAASGLFFFTSDLDAPLVTRKMELQDNVLPSANGVMGRCLAQLSELLERPPWKRRAEKMLARVLPEFSTYLLAHGGWGELALDLAAPHYLVSVLGPKARQAALAMAAYPLSQALVVAQAGAEQENLGHLPCLQGVDGGNRDLFIVCRDGSCLEPMDELATALEAIPAHFI